MKKFILISALAALLSACTQFTENLQVSSKPEGADVFVNNELVGQTPISVNLERDGVYEVRIAKKGYKDDVVSVASTRKDSFVKFGPLVDMGYYKQLAPAPIDAQLKPDFLPSYPGLTAFSDMTKSILKVDEMRKNGDISADEHSYLVQQIAAFYSQPMPAQ